MTRADCHSDHQYRALTLCRRERDSCPFGCTQDGAPNCDAHVRGIGLAAGAQCEAGKRTMSDGCKSFKKREPMQKINDQANNASGVGP